MENWLWLNYSRASADSTRAPGAGWPARVALNGVKSTLVVQLLLEMGCLWGGGIFFRLDGSLSLSWRQFTGKDFGGDPSIPSSVTSRGMMTSDLTGNRGQCTTASTPSSSSRKSLPTDALQLSPSSVSVMITSRNGRVLSLSRGTERSCPGEPSSLRRVGYPWEIHVSEGIKL